MDREYIVHEPESFVAVVEDILVYQRLQQLGTIVIALEGDLGAGKTTFTQILGKELGVTESITSPTFTIMKQYELDHELFAVLVHIDAYRFESEDEAVPLRLEEVFHIPRAIVCVEWPERIPTLLPKRAIAITISITDNEERNVKVRFPNESSPVS